MEAQVPEGGGGQAGAVALVADDDDTAVVARGLGDVVGTGGIEPPLEGVAIHHHGPRQLAVTPAVLGAADVHHQGAGGLLARQVIGPHPIETASLGPRGCERIEGWQ